MLERPERRRPASTSIARRSTSTSTPGTAAATPIPGFPKLLQRPDSIPGAEIITRPRSATSRRRQARHRLPDRRSSTTTRPRRRRLARAPAAASRNILTNLLANVLGGERPRLRGRSQRQHPARAGRPRRTGSCPTRCRSSGPGVDHIMANVDGDPQARGDRQRRERRRDGHERRRLEPVDYDSQPARRRGRRQVEGDQPVREPDRRQHRRRAGPRDHQGRRDAQPGREPGRRGRARTCPTTTSSRPGTRRPARRCRASRRRSRTTSCSRARRSRTSPTRPATRSSSGPASTTCATSTSRASRAPAGRSSPAAGSSRRPAIGDVGRRRQARGHDHDARGQHVHVGHRPARLRHERRVVDLAPRRVEHGRLRHRHAAARHADAGSPRHATRIGARSSGRRRATTGSAGPPTSTGSSSRTARSSTRPTAQSWATSPRGAAGSTESRTVASPGRFLAVLYKDENGNWGHLASTSISYPRPKGATPFRASLAAVVQAVHRSEPHPRPAARARLVQPAVAELEHAHGGHARRKRPGGPSRAPRCCST